MSHPSHGHSDVVPPQAEASQPKQAGKGLSTWERERIRSRAFAMWREEGFPATRRQEQWGLAQLQMIKSYPAG